MIHIVLIKKYIRSINNNFEYKINLEWNLSLEYFGCYNYKSEEIEKNIKI